MKKLKYIYYYIYSLLFCLRYLPFSLAKRIPILVHPSAKIVNLRRGGICIEGKVWKGMIAIGFQGTIGRCNRKTIVAIERDGKVIFNGYACISAGCNLVVKEGECVFGNNVFFNGDCNIYCYDSILFGDDLMCGWNVSFLTTNGHIIIVDGVAKEKIAPIVIGNHVWIGSDSVINKGVVIPNGCVCAHHSIVTKSLDEENSLYGGFPAKKLKSNVAWKP